MPSRATPMTATCTCGRSVRANVSSTVVPVDPLAVMQAMFGLWLLGMGFGLVNSVALELLPPLGAFFSLMLRPLYFLSGVMFPIMLIPYPYRDWLTLNPLVHGLEAMRLGFAPYYHVMPELNLGYDAERPPGSGEESREIESGDILDHFSAAAHDVAAAVHELEAEQEIARQSEARCERAG